MSSFDKREDSFEKKFAHDEELQFKAGARRNKLRRGALRIIVRNTFVDGSES